MPARAQNLKVFLSYLTQIKSNQNKTICIFGAPTAPTGGGLSSMSMSSIFQDGADPLARFNLLERLGEGYCDYLWLLTVFLLQFFRVSCVLLPLLRTNSNPRHPTTRSYGAVYKAEDKSSHEFRAIKIVPVEKELDELMNEIKILKKCNSEYITRYYGSYQHDDDVWV